MKKLPSMIFAICHGKTEGVFFVDLINFYILLKMDEVNFYSKNLVEPKISVLKNSENGESVTINSYKNNIKKFFFSKNNSYDIELLDKSSKKDILFISLIDIYERDEKEELRNFIINDEGHKSILMELLNDSPLEEIDEKLLFDSVFVYFADSIEDCLPRYEKNKDKIKGMKKWISHNVTSKDYVTTEMIKNIFCNIKNERSNVMSVFEYIDNLFEGND